MAGARGARRVALVRGSRRATVRVAAVAEAIKPMPPKEAAPIVEEIKDKLKYQLGKVGPIDIHSAYQGSAWSAREHLIDSFENTHEYWA